MILTIELASDKVQRLNERAKLLGISAEEFTQKVLEFIADTAEEDFEGWIETLDILSDKEFTSRLKLSIKQIEEERLTDWEEVKRELGLL